MDFLHAENLRQGTDSFTSTQKAGFEPANFGTRGERANHQTTEAAQDQAVSTVYVKNKILKKETDGECRLCKQNYETIDYLTSGCFILANNKYVLIHDKVCSHLLYSVCKALAFETTDKW
jgi:hypothetical protein